MTDRRAWVHGALFAGAFVATAALSAPRLPTQLHMTELKQQHLEAHKDEYTAVFFGSSRIFRNIAPTAFERQMARWNRTERAFNFGVPGMKLPESLHALERYLATHPENLHWVFVELADFATDSQDPSNLLSDRAVEWHDASGTARVARAVLGETGSWARKLDLLADHGLHFLYRESLVGRARPLLPGLVDTDITWDTLEDADFLGGRQGWLPLELETLPTYTRRHTFFLEQAEKYQTVIEELRLQQTLAAEHPDDRDLPVYEPYHQLCVERVIEIMAAQDARLVFVMMPLLRDDTHFKRAHSDGLIPDLIVLNDLDSCAEFYEPAARFDHNHLTQTASRKLTRRLVTELASLADLER